MQFMKNRKLVAAAVLTVLLLSLFTGCRQTPRPEDTVEQLQRAINTLDTDALLQCVDDTSARQIKMLLSFAFGDDGPSVSSLFRILHTFVPVLPLVSDGTVNSDDMPQIELTVVDTEMDGEWAIVDISGTVAWGKYEKPFSATLEMQFISGKWVVCGVR